MSYLYATEKSPHFRFDPANPMGVIAGVRPWPDDTHIWRPLAATKAPLLFVGNAAEVGAWAGASRLGSTEVIGSRVNECYDKLMRRINDHDAN